MAISPKQRISAIQAKRGRPPKSKLLKKKVSGLDKMTLNQLVSYEKKNAQCPKRKRATYDDLDENNEVKSAVMERAIEVQANLSSEFPSLIKYMLSSHVTRGFWLGLPRQFCSKHMPKEDKMIVLEDEEGKEFETKYLAEKAGLSGGWRGFSVAHKLLEGDVCVFHLVKPSKLKVYIIRKKGSDEVDGALGLLKLEASIQQMDLGMEPKICEKERDKPLEIHAVEEKRTFEETTGKSLEQPLDIFSKGVRKNVASEVLDGFKLSESIIDFKEVKGFEDFKIIVNGLIINSELSKYLQMKYYELCCSQDSFLHDHLLEGLNCKLVAGVIAETINIADAIRAAKLTTSYQSFPSWDQTLKSFEGLGMKVGFLRTRLDQLMNLSFKSKRYQEVKLEQVDAKEEKRKLEAKLLEVTEAINRLNGEIESLEGENANKLEILFHEVANAPW